MAKKEERKKPRCSCFERFFLQGWKLVLKLENP
jgi:hypothetical protein